MCRGRAAPAAAAVLELTRRHALRRIAAAELSRRHRVRLAAAPLPRLQLLGLLLGPELRLDCVVLAPPPHPLARLRLQSDSKRLRAPGRRGRPSRGLRLVRTRGLGLGLGLGSGLGLGLGLGLASSLGRGARLLNALPLALALARHLLPRLQRAAHRLLLRHLLLLPSALGHPGFLLLALLPGQRREIATSGAARRPPPRGPRRHRSPLRWRAGGRAS